MGLRDSTRPSNVCGTGKVALATLTVEVAWMVAYKPPRAPTNPWARAIADFGYITFWKKALTALRTLFRVLSRPFCCCRAGAITLRIADPIPLFALMSPD